MLSNFEAEYGRNSGAVINIVTKSGTNNLHGSLLEYNRTSAVGGARNFFNTTGPSNPFHNNQFGGSLGGPIIKDKTFFFVDYEGQRESGAQGGTSCVPTGSAPDGSPVPMMRATKLLKLSSPGTLAGAESRPSTGPNLRLHAVQ